jgi:hypothetical protein
MKEEEKNLISEYGDQEEVGDSEFGFVYDFFISKEKSGAGKRELTREKPQAIRKETFKNNEQSITFFLPDFFTDED